MEGFKKYQNSKNNKKKNVNLKIPIDEYLKKAINYQKIGDLSRASQIYEFL